LSQSPIAGVNQIIKRFLLMFTPAALVIMGGASALIQSEVMLHRALTRSSEVAALEVGVKSTEAIVHALITDLTLLAAGDELHKMLSGDANKRTSIPPADWLAFSRIKKIYDQIRWLDTEGQERARVNYNDGTPSIVSKEKLQNKSNRYYFADTFKLDRGQYFMSPLDLNVERGEVEFPLKPMIRIGTPLFDSNGEKQGIILLNYLGEGMLANFERMSDTSNSQAWLLNSDGYWLKGPSPELEWGFMLEKPMASVTDHHPSAWNRVVSAERGQFEDDHGLWTFQTIYPLKHSSSVKPEVPGETALSSYNNMATTDYYWKAVRVQSREQHYSSSWDIAKKILLVSGILIIISAVVCWRLAATWVGLRRAKKEVEHVNTTLEHSVHERTLELQDAIKRAETLARTDELTNLNNRRSFFHYGRFIYDQSRRSNKPFSIVMLDIDYFKKINDTYGHPAGDKALQAVSSTIEKVARVSDVPGRIGGEEFGLILPETTTQQAQLLAERLRQSISDLIVSRDQSSFKLTASLGVAQSTESDRSIDDIMVRADRALYDAKEQGRNRVSPG
jgi:diguanylate cyclase